MPGQCAGSCPQTMGVNAATHGQPGTEVLFASRRGQFRILVAVSGVARLSLNPLIQMNDNTYYLEYSLQLK